MQRAILPGFRPGEEEFGADLRAAGAGAQSGGGVDADGDGVLDKNGTRLNFRMVVRDDAQSKQIAESLQRSWKAIGVDVVVEQLDAATLIKEVIRPRDYEVLIFGQDLGTDSDPYVYWHSSQIQDPGLALAVEFDKDIDNSLETARVSTSLNQTIANYHKFQTAFADLVPAILL